MDVEHDSSFSACQMAEVAENFDILNDIQKLQTSGKKDLETLNLIKQGYHSQFCKTIANDPSLKNEGVFLQSQDCLEEYIDSIISAEKATKQAINGLKYKFGLNDDSTHNSNVGKDVNPGIDFISEYN